MWKSPKMTLGVADHRGPELNRRRDGRLALRHLLGGSVYLCIEPAPVPIPAQLCVTQRIPEREVTQRPLGACIDHDARVTPPIVGLHL